MRNLITVVLALVTAVVSFGYYISDNVDNAVYLLLLSLINLYIFRENTKEAK